MIRLLSFSFKGRSTRLEYWRVQLLSVILGALVGVISLVTIQWTRGFLFLGYLPVLALSLAVCVRRLHDRGRSGWWYLLFGGGPLLSAQLADASERTVDPLVFLVFGLATLALGVWGLIEIGFLRGRPGPNRYGDDPVMIAAITETFA